MSAPSHQSQPDGPREVIFSAARIAELLTVPPALPLTPTPEQRRMIEHPLGGSTLVVAGAGSGKTETMANRVVWLVANGLAAPDQVLGLTFTRKAAGELRERISGRLTAFADRLQDRAERGELAPAELERAAQIVALLADGLDIPEVSTYNAFAAGVLQEFGAAAAVDPDSIIIDEATAWRLARETVLASDDADLITSELRLPTLVRHVIDMDHAAADHLTTLDRVDQVVAEFRRVVDLPYNAKDVQGERSGKVYADVRTAVAQLAETPLITRLARAFAAEKRRRGVIEFSDQLALATRALEGSADGVAALRNRYRVVLLDEVQDTSVGQTRLLSMIFAGSSVMAVGDPHQSIYGWRGASAEGLQSFHDDFRPRGRGTRARTPAATLTLSTSWRNPGRVLEVANTVAAPLAADAVIDVPALLPRPGASAGSVEWLYPETIHEERHAVAQWFRRARADFLADRGELPSAAVIFRKRSHMAGFAAALSEAGVPNRIVGLGGLLTTPEVTDVVSALRCVWYADAAGDLIRLLAGPRFRVGAADIAGLRDAARWFADRDVSQQPLTADDVAADRVLPDPDRQLTLIDVLDQIATMRTLDHVALRAISPTGRSRLRDAGRMLASLRQGVGGSIGELLNATVQALRLDIELDANEVRHEHTAGQVHANLDVFSDLVEGYLSIDTRGTLASLLEWIERATESDETAEHVAAPVPGTVQLITAHGAKGLEWDLVAVPRLVTGEFPGAARSGAGWLRTGQLPDELRGDAAARPELRWRIAETQQELKGRIADYREALKDRHAEEERRLAYVAVTRSAGRLLLSGSFWGGQTRPRVPSPYLVELAERGLLGDSIGPAEATAAPVLSALPAESAHEADPSEIAEMTLVWPLDPLGTRAPVVHRAADAVREELTRRDAAREGIAARDGAPDADRAPVPGETSLPGDVPVPGDAPHRDGADLPVEEAVRLLLAERAAIEGASRSAGAPVGTAQHPVATETAGARAAAPAAALPERITASTFHEFVEDPTAAERRRVRPVPQRPYRRTRIGNRFHEWVERRATTARGTALPLAGFDIEAWDPAFAPGESEAESELAAVDARVTERELLPLIEQFERSRWADLRPIAVEQEVTLPFAGRSLVCKLDAVYRREAEDGVRFEVVDWKSGRSPRTEDERRSRFFQLDLYRHAYAQWAGVDPERIDVALFYVAEGVELVGEDPRSLAELERIWLDAAARVGGGEPPSGASRAGDAP